MVKNLEDVSTIATLLSFNSPQTLTQIVDARHPKRFLGLEGEPRPDLRSGHIHGSKNLFFRTLFENDNTFKAPEEINKVFEASNVSMKPDEHTIHMCGSGITACINILGMEIAGKKNLSLYDGSWMEWGKNVPDETPNPSVKGMIQQEYAKHEKKRLNIKD